MPYDARAGAVDGTSGAVVKPYRVVAPDGSELGRLLARSQEDAEKDARGYWPGRTFTVHEVEVKS